MKRGGGLNQSATRRDIKYSAKRLLGANLRVCLTVTVIYLLLFYISDNLTARYSPELVSINLDAIYNAVLNGDISALINVSDYIAVNVTVRRLLLFFAIQLLSVVILAPFNMGMTEIYVDLSRGSEARASQAGGWYLKSNLAVKAVVLSILVSLISNCASLICSGLPALGFYYLNTYPFTLPQLNMYYGLSAVLMVTSLGGTLLAAIISVLYQPAAYLMAGRKSMGVIEALRGSRRLLKGHVWEYFVFYLSFMLWFLLVNATFGLAYIYVLPFYTAANALFIRYVKQEKGGGSPNVDFTVGSDDGY